MGGRILTSPGKKEIVERVVNGISEIMFGVLFDEWPLEFGHSWYFFTQLMLTRFCYLIISIHDDVVLVVDNEYKIERRVVSFVTWFKSWEVRRVLKLTYV